MLQTLHSGLVNAADGLIYTTCLTPRNQNTAGQPDQRNIPSIMFPETTQLFQTYGLLLSGQQYGESGAASGASGNIITALAEETKQTAPYQYVGDQNSSSVELKPAAVVWWTIYASLFAHQRSSGPAFWRQKEEAKMTIT